MEKNKLVWDGGKILFDLVIVATASGFVKIYRDYPHDNLIFSILRG